MLFLFVNMTRYLCLKFNMFKKNISLFHAQEREMILREKQ
jgi:hypothetical protein